jgi:MoaA/NifB/PqqE/SkfB family radical SAM enzyme
MVGQNVAPSYLLLFVTNRCDAHCSHCFYWRQRNNGGRELSLAEIETLARRCGSLVQLTLTGGSPELRPDLSEIAGIFWRHCAPLNITLCSNGNRPETLAAAVLRICGENPGCKLTVDISVDGIGDEHDRLRRVPGLFVRVCRSYALLADIRRRHPALRLGCGLCVSGLNHSTAVHTAEWAMNTLPIDNFTPVLVRGQPEDHAALAVDSAVFMRIANEVEKRLADGRFRGYASYPGLVNRKDIIQKRLIHRIFTSGSSPIRCSAARETAVIYPDGTVAACELRNESLGSLHDAGMDLRRLWRGSAARRFRATIRREKCSCWHQCFLSPTIVKSPRLWIHP